MLPGRVGERVAAVVPAVRVGDGRVGRLAAVDGQASEPCRPVPPAGVRDAVAEDDRVGRRGRGELDVLAGAAG